MKIDRKLNLIIPVEQDDGSTVYVHCAPISRDVFERYFQSISRTYASMYANDTMLVGMRIASLTLKRLAMESGQWEGPIGVQMGLVEEIRRLSNVLTPAAKGGWETIPLMEAKARGFLSDDDIAEVDNAATFFTVVWSVQTKAIREAALTGACALWNAQVSLLNVTEYGHSLKTQTTEETTGPQTRASIPH